MAEVGGRYGLVMAAATLTGSLGGGALADALARRDGRWLVRLPAVILIASVPIVESAVLTRDFSWLLAAMFGGGVALGAAVPTMFSAFHRVCGSPRRAMAVAIAFFFANLLGLGFGPLITGALSDRLTALYGPIGLRYALMLAFGFLIPSAVALWWSAASLARDAEA